MNEQFLPTYLSSCLHCMSIKEKSYIWRCLSRKYECQKKCYCIKHKCYNKSKENHKIKHLIFKKKEKKKKNKDVCNCSLSVFFKLEKE